MTLRERAEIEASALREFLHSPPFVALVEAAHDLRYQMKTALRADILRCEKVLLDKIEGDISDA